MNLRRLAETMKSLSHTIAALNRNNRQMAEALQAFVDLDDGDEPLAWKYPRAFSKARTALSDNKTWKVDTL